MHCITKTCLYNFDPIKPHFYTVKLRFTGVYIIFLIYTQKHRLWVLVRTASAKPKYEKLSEFFLSENFQILELNFSIYLNRRVFVMSLPTEYTVSNETKLFSHYENTPIQIYRQSHLQKLKIFR